jgi:hypothetical protein
MLRIQMEWFSHFYEWAESNYIEARMMQDIRAVYKNGCIKILEGK